jgi:hypothetical protein
MIERDPSYWPGLLERTLRRYEEGLLRQVAGQLLRPRNQWPVDELVARCVATTADITIIERRLKELEPAERRLLAAIGHSRQPLWPLGSLVELMLALGVEDGLKPVFALLQAGLLFPLLPGIETTSKRAALKSFEQWLAFASPHGLQVFAHPLAMERAVGEDLGLSALETVSVTGPVLEADGLDWPLRLAVLWQRLGEAPLRRTQQGDFFKRDHDRLENDALLNGATDEGLPGVTDAGFLAVALATVLGVVSETDGELRAAPLPTDWDEGLPHVLSALWQALPQVRGWGPLDGWRQAEQAGNPFLSAGLLAVLLLARLPAERWTTPMAVQEWIAAHHPFWAAEGMRPSRQRDWTTSYLLGLTYQLRMVQAARTAEGTLAVRLSPLGRWVLGLADAPPAQPPFPRTLLVQPNLEIVAYRQGLTPGLITFLARIATWQSLGSVCLLQLGPDSVYRGLEGGLNFDSILQTLEKHGTRPTPPAVVDSLRTWADKRDRITVYPSAALLEFGTKEALDAALARGFPGVRIDDRLAVVASEASIDYTLFRLISSRDYASRPEQCVEVADDGVTLTVDVTRSDLLLESELSRFTEAVDRPGGNGRWRYRLTPSSMQAARDGGMNAPSLETWFQQRTGQSAPPAALLLLTADQEARPTLRRHLVLEVASEAAADGLMQWPPSRALITTRLGPTTLSVPEAEIEKLRELLRQIGVDLQPEAR